MKLSLTRGVGLAVPPIYIVEALNPPLMMGRLGRLFPSWVCGSAVSLASERAQLAVRVREEMGSALVGIR